MGAHLLKLDRVSVPAENRIAYNYWSILTVNKFIDEFVEMAEFCSLNLCLSESEDTLISA